VRVKFDPATATYTDYAGALGAPNTTYPLQCPGAKNATCLSAAQIEAAKQTHRGPRSNGKLVLSPAGAVAPDHVSNVVQGYAYDGGWMTTVGIPSRKIGSSNATSLPGDFSLGVGTFGYAFLTPACPTCYTLDFDFDTLTLTQGSNVYTMNPSTPIVTSSTSLDISRFVDYGRKVIWYHGASDPGPPILGTQLYYQQMAHQHGGWRQPSASRGSIPCPTWATATGARRPTGSISSRRWSNGSKTAPRRVRLPRRAETLPPRITR